MLSHARTVLSPYHSLSLSPSFSLSLSLALSLSFSLPPWWLMANAALVHLYIPPHPSLANRCEILDMAWIWLPGEKGGFDWIGEGKNFHLPEHPCLLFFFSFFPIWLSFSLLCHWLPFFTYLWNSTYFYTSHFDHHKRYMSLHRLLLFADQGYEFPKITRKDSLFSHTYFSISSISLAWT